MRMMSGGYRCLVVGKEEREGKRPSLESSSSPLSPLLARLVARVERGKLAAKPQQLRNNDDDVEDPRAAIARRLIGPGLDSRRRAPCRGKAPPQRMDAACVRCCCVYAACACVRSYLPSLPPA